MFKFCISFRKILKLLFFFFWFQLLLLYLHEVLFHLHYSCALCIHTILRSYWMSWDFGEFSDCMDFGTGTASPLLHVVNPTFDYVPPKPVSLFITDMQVNKIFCKFQEGKDLPGFQNYIYSGAHLKSLSCAPLWNCCYPVLVLAWMQTFCSLLYAFSLVLKILNTFIPILIFQILLSCNCYK